MCGVIWERVDNKRSHLFIICCTDNLFGKMNQSSMKEGTNSRQQPERTSESSSFKQIIRGVESLINDQEDNPISNFELAQVPRPVSSINPCMTNGEKLQFLMRNTEVRDKITSYLRQNGYMDTFPILKVSILRNNRQDKDYELHEEDLVEVFRRFDNLEKVIIKANGVYIFFSDHHSAYFAEKTLHQVQLEELKAKLLVTWCQPSQYMYISECLNFESSRRTPELSRTNSSNPKFTCRYQIQIQNDREFQVARKIIGTKGFNMKKIIDSCLGEIGADPKTESDSIKLRLRGKGSGYKEGPNKLESSEPLHLCISCRDQFAYSKACKLVEELLKGIYKEYKIFCIKTGKKTEDLSVKRLDYHQVQPSKHSFYNFDQSSQHCSSNFQSDRISQTQIKAYIEARNKARRELNFIEADRIRNYLKTRGVALIDQKGGRGRGVQVTTWRFSN